MILLYGGSGFLGKHIAVRLEAEAPSCVVVSRNPSKDEFAVIAPGSTLLRTDEFERRSRAVLEHAECVVYLVGTSAPATSGMSLTGEIEGTLARANRFVETILSEAPALPIIFISSGGAIYGNTSQERISEDHPTRPISSYGLGKLYVEEALAFWGRVRGLRYNVLRVSNPIGRWHTHQEQGIVPAIIRSLVRRVPVRIYGDGQAVRDYIDAGDFADAVLALIKSDHLGSGATWNIGSGSGLSVKEIIDLVALESGIEPVLEYVGSRPTDVRRVVLDCTRAERDLEWRPRVPVQQSIAGVLQDFGVSIRRSR